jgi:prepilin-type N-terminal cleavage/methylation domain-containing protein
MREVKSHRRRQAGFTMVEVVIVVLIVSILVAAAAPRLADSLYYYRAEAAAERIRADLELARKHAVTSSANQQVAFSTAADHYTLVNVPDPDHASLQYEVRLSHAPYRASLSSVDFGGDEMVQFDGYGVPDSGGTVVIQAGAYQKTVTLDPDSGRATLQ